jgi:hypothetical protein
MGKCNEKKVYIQNFSSTTNVCTSNFFTFQYLYSYDFSSFNKSVPFTDVLLYEDDNCILSFFQYTPIGIKFYVKIIPQYLSDIFWLGKNDFELFGL